MGAGFLAGVLGGCAIGPDYHRPDMAVPAAFKEAAGWKLAAPNDAVLRGRWWTVFGDADLDRLMAQVDLTVPALAQAEARYRQSVVATDSARSSLFPSVSASASETRSRAGSARGGSASGGTTTSRSVSASFNWELDLWGRLRRQLESSSAAAEASAADLESARLSLLSQVATNYFQLRVADAQRQLLDETVAAYQKSLELTRNRYNAGVAAKSDVVQAETQLYSAQAQLIDLTAQRAQLEHALAVLLGKAPADFTLATRPWSVEVPGLPAALPSTLLERRPDVAAAERRAMSANASIGVARAAYFPSLSLPGSLGYSGSATGNLISAANRVWSIGPALAVSLLDFGKRGAAVDQSVAAYDQAVAGYRETVLQAFQEVEDNLVSLRLLGEEAKVQDEAVRAARESVTLTTNQYKAGIVSYLNVVTVQTAQLSNERTSMSLKGRRLNAAVGLIKALGGGWQGLPAD